jgi:hypothetical protein
MTAARLTSIPPDDWARVAEARDATIRRVTVTGVPFDEFKQAAAVCYAAINEPAPAVVVAPSPLVALLWSAMLRSSIDGQLGGQLGSQLGGLGGQLGFQLSGQLSGQLYDQLRRLYGRLDAQLSAQLGAQLGAQLDDQLYGQLYGQLDGQLSGQLSDQLYGQLGGQLGAQLDDQLSAQLYGQLGGQLGAQLSVQLSGQLYGQLGGQLSAQLSAQLGAQLGGQLGGQLNAQLSDQLGDQLGDQLNGLHWSGWRQAWQTHWLTINTLTGIQPAPADLVATLTAYQTFCVPTFTIPLRGIVIGLGPHVAVEFDNNRQLHCPTGPAWVWPTGEAIYAWHGTRVPEWALHPTLEHIGAEKNTEIRRCAIEAFGWAEFLEALHAEPVDMADDPGNPGHQLALYDIPRGYRGSIRVRLLVMQNASRDRDGRRRTFAETVPVDCTTAVDAAAWQFNIDPTVYRALQRAT